MATTHTSASLYVEANGMINGTRETSPQVSSRGGT